MGKSIDISTVKKIYFLGIGGIGMSALARFFHRSEVEIFGYDLTETRLTNDLEDLGMHIHYNEDTGAIPSDIDLVIYTPAIPDGHKEWPALRSLNVPILKRAEVLGLISQNHKTIAVAGTHGKTSTSALVTHVLRTCDIDVNAFVGGIMANYKSNFVFGESNWMVVEADEFDRSFMHLHPNIAVLNSVDPDHLDIYNDHQQMLQTFQDFTLNIEQGGTLLAHTSVVPFIDNEWKTKLLDRDIQMFSFGAKEGWYRAESIEVIGHQYQFDFYKNNLKISNNNLQMPGMHNVSNAIAALAIADVLQLDPQKASDGIESFTGIKRRFEFIYQDDNTVMIDDYAHHPSEIDAAISAAKSLYPDKELTVIFQPHLFTRTRDFMAGFAQSLDKADQLVLMPIYPAREEPIEGITSDALRQLLSTQNDTQILDHDQVISHIEDTSPELLLILGAGNISRIADFFTDKMLKV